MVVSPQPGATRAGRCPASGWQLACSRLIVISCRVVPESSTNEGVDANPNRAANIPPSPSASTKTARRPVVDSHDCPSPTDKLVTPGLAFALPTAMMLMKLLRRLLAVGSEDRLLPGIPRARESAAVRGWQPSC